MADINKGLDQLSNSASDVNSQIVGTDIAESNIPIDKEAVNPSMDSVFTGEEVKVAGKMSILKGLIEEALPSSKRIVPQEVKAGRRAKTEAPVEEEVVTQPTEPVTPAPEDPTVTEPFKPSTPKDVADVIKRQNEILQEGNVPFTAPSPTAKQKGEGVLQSRINTVATTDDEMRALEHAIYEKVVKSKEFKTTTVNDLIKDAGSLGLREQELQRILNGQPLEATLKDNTLAMKIAIMKEEYRNRRARVDLLIKKHKESDLDVEERYNLMVDMAAMSKISGDLTGAGREIGTALNAFKDVQRLGPNVELSDLKNVLNENYNEDVFNRFVKMYDVAETDFAKNALINTQGGNMTKFMDKLYSTFQSNILNDPKTWMDNLIGSTMHGSLMSLEDVVSSVVVSPITNSIRRFRGKEVPQDIAELDDVLTGFKGFWGGIKDGWQGAAHVIKTGERAGFKGERFDTISSRIIPDHLKVKNPLTQVTREYNTSELKNSWVGKIFDGIGFMQSIPMRMLAAGDEIVGNTISRIALHREASMYAKQRLNELRALGKTDQEIRETLVNEVANFVNTQPAEIFTSVKEVKDLIQFTYKWDQTRFLDKGYIAVNKLLSLPVVRYMVPFSNTLTKIIDQTASRIPGMNFISPQFYKDIGRGGKYTDRAISRLAVGGTGLYFAYEGASNNIFTGSGPIDPGHRAALMKTGWQPYSIQISMDDKSFTKQHIDRLKELTSVTEGNGKYYISYQRFDMVAPILGMGADLFDSYRFSQEDPTVAESEALFKAYASSSAEFLSNLPAFQFLGELTELTGGHYEDKGDKVVDIIERMTIGIGKNLALMTPGVGLTQSSLASHIAKLIDENKKSKMSDKPAYGITDQASIILDQIQNAWYDRTPVLRGQLEDELDNAGRPIYNQNTIHQHWINIIPSMSMSKESYSEMDAVLAENYHGISYPSKEWDDVKLGSKEFHDYKKLYGQKIKLPIAINADGDMEYMNMEKAIPARVKALKEEFAAEGQKIFIGDIRDEIDHTVAMYRKEAKRQMLGEVEEIDDTLTKDKYIRYTGEWKDEDGNIQTSKYKELIEKINQARAVKRRTLK
jgi:hypothetical protein